MMIQINKKQIAYNRTKRTKDILYIVVHDTGNVDIGANAERHFQYFNGANRDSSADIFTDDTQALQVNDYHTYYTWHCGDGGGKYGITNSNSVGVEMCINADGDYDKAFANTVEVVKYLMSELDIDINHVVRHYDASRKNCPASFSSNNWARWAAFKAALTQTAEHWAASYYRALKARGYITDPLWQGYDYDIPVANALALLDNISGGMWTSDEDDYSVHWCQPIIISLCGKRWISDKEQYINAVTQNENLSNALSVMNIEPCL